MATMDFCDGDYLGTYRRFLEHFVANVCRDDQLPVKMSRRDVRLCEVVGEIADITLQHLNQRICPPSLQAYLVKLAIAEFKILLQIQPENCGYRMDDRTFSPLKLMQAVTNKVNEICQRYLDNSRLALLPPPPSTPLPLSSSHAIRNRRRKMEDRSVVLHDLHTMFSIKNDAVVNYYAVFDGHAGQEAATYCAAHLHQYLIESPYYPTNIEFALQDAFQTTNNKFIESDDTKNSGATAVCALLYDKTLYVAWAGDSQAALIKNGRGINLTIPHKPERPDEKLRIESLGGEVIFHGTWRVNGILNISRSLGDVKYKPYVSGEPEIKRIELDGTEDFLVVACDGFWDRATEEIVASLLYEYVCSPNCDYSSASAALVNWAKQNLCEDNISVIVVFLTPPAEIAAKSFLDPRPVQCVSSMEPGYQKEPQPYDLDFGFGKQQPISQIHETNGGDVGLTDSCAANAVLDSINGKYRPKPPRYNDDDDDDDDDDDEEEEDEDPEEEDDVDLGPETNVDAVDDVLDKVTKQFQNLCQTNSSEFGVEKPPVSPMDDLFLMGNVHVNKSHENELIPEADNVADSEDSEDEWNYYRPGDNNKSGGTNAVSAPVGQSKDPALVEKPDQCEGEKELCSPKPFEDANLINQPVSSSAEVDAETGVAAPADDDVTAEYDESHEIILDTKERESEQELIQTDIEASTIPEEPFSFEKERQEHLPQHFEENKCENDFESEQELEQEQEQKHEHEHNHEHEHKHEHERKHEQDYEKSEQEQQFVKEQEQLDESDDDMESHLNPNAAEFVPISNTPPTIPERMTQMSSDLIAGSPLKQSQRALKNQKIPSEQEFQEEICRRPSEIDDSIVDYTNGDVSPPRNLLGNFDDNKQYSANNQPNLDESEISSTKAECNDSTANFSVTSDFYKSGISGIDCSYTGSDRGDFDFSLSSRDAMVTSMTPGDFKNAFEQEVDLNKVHELHDEDLMDDMQNGTILENDEKMIVDDVDELVKEKIDLHFENFDAEQKQSAEVFSAIVEQKESDNKDLFMNKLNTERDLKLEQNNLIDTAEYSEITSTVNGTSPGDLPPYASNNPFATDYVSSTEPEFDIQNLSDDLQTINLQNSQEQLLDVNLAPATEEPESMQNNVREEVMQNPLDLNFGATFAEQKSDEPVLVSPVKEPEVMTSKIAEENLITEAVEALQQESNEVNQDDFFTKTNHVGNFSPAASTVEFVEINPMLPENLINIIEKTEINLSESLQEFTGLEEQLNPSQYLVKDNINVDESQILKENLVDEQKDIEEVVSTVITDRQPEETLVITNEHNLESKEILENDILPSSTPIETTPATAKVTATAVVAAATAATAALATSLTADTTVKATKTATAVTKASKPTVTSKVGTKSTTPTSPTKSSVTTKAAPITANTKKMPASTLAGTPRPKPTSGLTTKTSSSILNKTTTLTKTTSTSKTSSTTAAKSAPRPAVPKPKSLSSVTSKASSTSADKKPTTNGDIKSLGKPTLAPRTTTKSLKSTTNSSSSTTTTRTTLVKTSASARNGGTLTGSGDAPKPRPISAATRSTTTTSKVSSTNVSSSTNNGTARPKTAPPSTLSATTKTKIGAKSPIIDKQIKETANKQISSGRISATTKTRLSTSTTSAPTKRMSLAPKPPATTLSSSPAKKLAPNTKLTSKTTATAKVGSKVTSTTKNNISATTKVVQNGVCESEETKIKTNTTTTTVITNIEEDIPKKDISPIEPLTDNQLITAE